MVGPLKFCPPHCDHAALHDPVVAGVGPPVAVATGALAVGFVVISCFGVGFGVPLCLGVGFLVPLCLEVGFLVPFCLGVGFFVGTNVGALTGDEGALTGDVGALEMGASTGAEVLARRLVGAIVEAASDGEDETGEVGTDPGACV